MNSLRGLYGRAKELNRACHLVPQIASLNLSKGELVVDYLSQHEIPDAYTLVTDAASRGDNVGLQEYPDIMSFTEWLYFNDSFTLRDPSDATLKGLVSVGPSFYTRSTRPTLANLTSFTTAELSAKEGMDRDLARIGEKITRCLGLGYTAIIKSVFTSQTNTYLSLTAEGFNPCAVIPESGTLANFGIDNSAFLYKAIADSENFKVEDLDPLSLDHDAVLTENGISPFLETSNAGKQWQCQQVPGLPVDYTFGTGVKTILRNMQADDIPILHELFVHYGNTGQGFGMDEYPCLPDMMEIMKNYYNLIFEDRSTSRPVAMMSFGDSYYSRGERYVDGSAFVLPEYFGAHARMGTEVVRVLFGLSKDLGFYRGGLTDIVITNLKTLKMNRRHGYITVGCLPRSVRMVDRGWVDTLLYYVPLQDSFKSFKQIIEEQRSTF